jgi:hypothetical protein
VAEANDGVFIGEDADHLGPPLEFDIGCFAASSEAVNR